MREAYAKFASQVDADGYLIVKKGAILDTSKVRAKVLSYAFKAGEGKAPDFYASDIEPIKKDGKETGMFRFTLNCPPGIGNVEGCTVGVPGWVNIENAVAASSVALLAGIDKESLKKALASFRGVQRRMDIHVNTPKVVYIDDYAHHPQEIATTISSLREAFPDRKLTAVFQPHLYTRTRDLADGFSQALSTADSVILLDIYPARELPIEGVSSELIFNKMNLSDKMLITKEELLDTIKNRLEEGKIDLLVTFGAGNIDRFVEPLEKMLK